MPTSRNARGIDIIIFSQDASKKYTIQVKSLSKRSPVPLGSRQNSIFGDFLIICRNLFTNPEVFVTCKNYDLYGSLLLVTYHIASQILAPFEILIWYHLIFR